MLDELKKISARFQIDPQGTIGHAARLDSVIKVLQGINISYTNFLKIEFLKNDQFNDVYEKNPKVFDSVREDLELLIVDLKFSSFEAAVAPNITSKNTLFKNEVSEWERDTFLNYRDSVLFADFEDPSYFSNTLEKYSAEERHRIFQPLFAVVDRDKPYKVNLISDTGKKQRLRKPHDVIHDAYLPKRMRDISYPNDTKIVQFFARMEKNGDQYKFNRNTLKDVVYYEELDYETYPFKPDIINYSSVTYILSQRLICDVSFDDGLYVINNELLDITVWGDNRDEAEEAFAFAFHSMYINYAEESDELLSDEAKELKITLLDLVKTVK